MAQWVKRLLWKCEELSLGPKHSRVRHSGGACDPALGRQRQADPWISLVNQLRDLRSLSFTKQRMAQEDIWHQPLASTRMCIYVRFHICTHTYTTHKEME